MYDFPEYSLCVAFSECRSLVDGGATGCGAEQELAPRGGGGATRQHGLPSAESAQAELLTELEEGGLPYLSAGKDCCWTSFQPRNADLGGSVPHCNQAFLSSPPSLGPWTKYEWCFLFFSHLGGAAHGALICPKPTCRAQASARLASGPEAFQLSYVVLRTRNLL